MAKIPTYWNGKGKYQKQLDELEGLIPLMGKAKGKKLDKLREVMNVYYDIFNNGLDNYASEVGFHFELDEDPAEPCDYCLGTGRNDGEDCRFCEGNEYPEKKQWVKKVYRGEGDAKNIEKKMDELILEAAKEQGVDGKSTPKKSSLELKNLTSELKKATEQLKKIADEKKKHLPGQRELQLQLQPVVEAIKKVNEKAMKMTPGMEAFLNAKPSFWGSEKYYEQIEQEIKKKVLH